MIRDKNKFFLEIHQLFDFLILGLVFLLAYYTKIALVPDIIRGLAAGQGQHYTLVFLLTTICCQFNLRFAETYPPFKSKSLGNLVVLTKVIFFGILLAVIFLYITHLADISRLLMGLFTVYAVILLSALKYVLNINHIRNDQPAEKAKNMVLSLPRKLQIMLRQSMAGTYHE